MSCVYVRRACTYYIDSFIVSRCELRVEHHHSEQLAAHRLSGVVVRFVPFWTDVALSSGIHVSASRSGRHGVVSCGVCILRFRFLGGCLAGLFFLGRFRVLFFLPLRRLSFLNFTHETLFHPSFLLTAAQIPNRFELSRGCGMTATHFRLLKASKQTNKQSERPRLLIKEMSM